MRGRKAQVRYYQSKRGYYTVYQGISHKLAEGPDDAPGGPTYRQALTAFLEVMNKANAMEAQDENSLRTIAQLYLESLVGQKSARTHKIRSSFLLGFLGFRVGGVLVGDMHVGELAQEFVELYVRERSKERSHQRLGHTISWSKGTATIFETSLHACLNWAARKKLIRGNPLGARQETHYQSRGSALLVNDELHHQVLSLVQDDLKQLVVVAKLTGCRPGELFMAEAKNVDCRRRAIVYHSKTRLAEGDAAHKTSGKGRDRIIFLAGEALAIVESLVQRYPTGLLFRSRLASKRGNSWTHNKVSARLATLKKAGKLPPAFTLYAYRHTFATNWLLAGRSIEKLAALLGNSVGVIRRHYSHLCDHPASLRGELEAFCADDAQPSRGPHAPGDQDTHRR